MANKAERFIARKASQYAFDGDRVTASITLTNVVEHKLGLGLNKKIPPEYQRAIIDYCKTLTK